MANSLQVSRDRETGNEEQHVSPLNSVGRKTNGAWLISSALGLLEQRGPECRRDVVQPACGRPGRPLVVRGSQTRRPGLRRWMGCCFASEARSPVPPKLGAREVHADVELFSHP